LEACLILDKSYNYTAMVEFTTAKNTQKYIKPKNIYHTTETIVQQIYFNLEYKLCFFKLTI